MSPVPCAGPRLSTVLSHPCGDAIILAGGCGSLLPAAAPASDLVLSPGGIAAASAVRLRPAVATAAAEWASRRVLAASPQAVEEASARLEAAVRARLLPKATDGGGSGGVEAVEPHKRLRILLDLTRPTSARHWATRREYLALRKQHQQQPGPSVAADPADSRPNDDFISAAVRALVGAQLRLDCAREARDDAAMRAPAVLCALPPVPAAAGGGASSGGRRHRTRSAALSGWGAAADKKKQYAAVCCAGRWGFLTEAAIAAERDVAAALESLRLERAAAAEMERGVAELIRSRRARNVLDTR